MAQETKVYAGLTDSESGPEFIASYKKVIVDLDRLLDLDFDVLCKEGISETTETLIEEVYSKLCDISNSEKLDETCEVILTTMCGSLKVLHDFLEKAVMTLADGVTLMKSYFYVLCMFGIMSNCEAVCRELVTGGLLIQMEHLIRFSSNPLTKTLRKLVLSLLNTTYNCAYNIGINNYPLQIPYFTLVLEPYCRCPDIAISFFSKMILAMVQDVLIDADFEIFKLRKEELDEIMPALNKSSISTDSVVGIFEYTFSSEEVLFALKHLLSCRANLETLLQMDIIPSLVSFMHCSNPAVKTLACHLLLILLMESSFKQACLSSDLPLLEALQELTQSTTSEVKNIALCTLEELGYSDAEVDRSEITRTFFALGFYHKAITTCNSILSTPNYTDSKAKLIAGMSNFKLYRREQFILSQSKQLLPTSEWHQRHQLCYEKAKECIVSLGMVLDNSGKLDAEASRMLDLALVNYSTQTNSLDKLKRCALCRKRGKLYHSHVFPRSILEAICSSLPTSANKKNVDSYRQGQLRTPKQATTFLFCSSCEKVFSDHGETQFPPHFFKKVYNEIDPLSITLEQHIKYEEWLYQFCVGIVFRSLCESLDDGYINDDSFYELFAQCRHCMLNPHHALSAAEEQRPLIAMVINPTTGDKESAKYGFINFALTSGIGLTTISIMSLDSIIPVNPQKVYFVLVSFGIFSLIAFVERENAKCLSKEWFINPKGGEYHVLEDMKRHEIFPVGLWKLFCETAEEHEKRYLEGRAMLDVSKLQIKSPDPNKVSTYGIAGAFESDVASFDNTVVAAPLPDSNKVISILPVGFSVTNMPERSLIHLPQGHRLIMHFNISIAAEEGGTVFLAVGDPDSKPYIIYHEYSQGVQFSSGFYINSDTGVAEGYLLDKSKENYIVKLSQGVQNLYSEIHTVLPVLLHSKGIQSLKSLLLFTQKRPNANFDIKCSDHLHCWYCNMRCNVCLEPIAFGMMTTLKDGGTKLSFCSEKCQSLLSSENNFQAFDSFESPPHMYSHTCAVSSNHRELAYVLFQYTSSEEGYGYFDLTLAQGDAEEERNKERVYCVMYFRGLQQQLSLGFYLTEQLKPTFDSSSLTPYFPGKDLDLFSPGDVSYLVTTCLEHLHCADLHALVERHQNT